MSAAGSASQGTKRKNFNVLEREEVIRHLLANSKDRVLRHGSYQEAAVKYGCGWETIKGVWAKHEQREAAGDPSAYIGNNRKGKSGRKGIDLEDLRTRLRDIPLTAVGAGPRSTWFFHVFVNPGMNIDCPLPF